jgi:hypothetical protein
MLAGLGLAGCLPIPQVVPERLTLRYLGAEPVSVNMNCANTNEFMFIEGPHSVRLRVSPKYFPELRRAVLQMGLVAIQGRPAMVESQEIAVIPADGGPVRSVAVVSEMRAPGKTHDFDVRIEDFPPAPVRVGLPRIRIGGEEWRPADLELRPTGAVMRPMPFNC